MARACCTDDRRRADGVRHRRLPDTHRSITTQYTRLIVKVACTTDVTVIAAAGAKVIDRGLSIQRYICAVIDKRTGDLVCTRSPRAMHVATRPATVDLPKGDATGVPLSFTGVSP